MFGLIYLPYEVLANIVGHVDFDDVFSLGITCKALTFLLAEESIAKMLIQVGFSSVESCGFEVMGFQLLTVRTE